jgi:nitrite reductase/ring-hydroxylating ferredoxin subunit
MSRTERPAALDPKRPSTLQASWPARLVGPLEEMSWLDRLGNTVMGWLQPLLDRPGADRVKDVLHGRWLGHALHPVLTDLPIGFWTAAFVLDLAGARFSARFMNACGCASAVGTAATGVADWTVTDGRERRLGLLHGLLNGAGLACQLVALVSRRRYRTWSWTGYAISSASAYLGGELVFGRGLMVDHDAWVAGPQDWTDVMSDADVPEGSMRPAQVDGRTILLSRQGGRVSALEDACPHAGGPLHEGTLEAGVVTCPWHGSRFRLADGACLRGPSTFAQLRLEARVRAGRIEVRGRQG